MNQDGSFSKWLYFYISIVVAFVLFVVYYLLKPNYAKASLIVRNEIQTQSGEVHLSSLATAKNNLDRTEYEFLKKLSREDLVSRLQKGRSAWFLKNKNYSLTPESISDLEKKYNREIPKKFESNPAFKIFRRVAGVVSPLRYEDVIACDSKRLFYQRGLRDQTELRGLLEQRKPRQDDYDSRCVLHAMKDFEVPRMGYGLCSKSEGPVQTPGAKPCMTPLLVSVTAQLFSDMASCLGEDAHVPALRFRFDSGFFMNTFGVQGRAGIGQLGTADISALNQVIPEYMRQIEVRSVTNEACKQVLKYKNWLTSAPEGLDQRCSMIGFPHNPTRNLFYSVLQHRVNRDRIKKFIQAEDVSSQLGQLGLEGSRVLSVIEDSLVLAAAVMGHEKATSLLREYLKARIAEQKKLKPQDFDFYHIYSVTDLDGQLKSDVEVARLFVLSSYIKSTDPENTISLKVERRREFPRVWLQAHENRFPVFLTLKANAYTGDSLNAFEIYGFPGYVSLLAEKNKELRQSLVDHGIDPNICARQDFLKYDEPN